MSSKGKPRIARLGEHHGRRVAACRGVCTYEWASHLWDVAAHEYSCAVAVGESAIWQAHMRLTPACAPNSGGSMCSLVCRPSRARIPHPFPSLAGRSAGVGVSQTPQRLSAHKSHPSLRLLTSTWRWLIDSHWPRWLLSIFATV